MAEVVLYDQQANEKGKVTVDPALFDGKVNATLLYEAVTMYLANRRQGNASTKTRAFISGGGKKPWRQKGTGRARAGSIRSPLWRHGGVIFGPHPRDFSYRLPQKMRLGALRSSLNDKLNNAKMQVINELSIATPKTKEFAGLISNFKLKDKTMFLVEKIDRNLFLAARNLPKVFIKNASDVTAYDILWHDTVIATKGALDILTKRLVNKKPVIRD